MALLWQRSKLEIAKSSRSWWWISKPSKETITQQAIQHATALKKAIEKQDYHAYLDIIRLIGWLLYDLKQYDEKGYVANEQIIRKKINEVFAKQAPDRKEEQFTLIWICAIQAWWHEYPSYEGAGGDEIIEIPNWQSHLVPNARYELMPNAFYKVERYNQMTCAFNLLNEELWKPRAEDDKREEVLEKNKPEIQAFTLDKVDCAGKSIGEFKTIKEQIAYYCGKLFALLSALGCSLGTGIASLGFLNIPFACVLIAFYLLATGKAGGEVIDRPMSMIALGMILAIGVPLALGVWFTPYAVIGGAIVIGLAGFFSNWRAFSNETPEIMIDTMRCSLLRFWNGKTLSTLSYKQITILAIMSIPFGLVGLGLGILLFNHISGLTLLIALMGPALPYFAGALCIGVFLAYALMMFSFFAKALRSDSFLDFLAKPFEYVSNAIEKLNLKPWQKVLIILATILTCGLTVFGIEHLGIAQISDLYDLFRNMSISHNVATILSQISGYLVIPATLSFIYVTLTARLTATVIWLKEMTMKDIWESLTAAFVSKRKLIGECNFRILHNKAITHDNREKLVRIDEQPQKNSNGKVQNPEVVIIQFNGDYKIYFKKGDNKIEHKNINQEKNNILYKELNKLIKAVQIHIDNDGLLDKKNIDNKPNNTVVKKHKGEDKRAIAQLNDIVYKIITDRHLPKITRFINGSSEFITHMTSKAGTWITNAAGNAALIFVALLEIIQEFMHLIIATIAGWWASFCIAAGSNRKNKSKEVSDNQIIDNMNGEISNKITKNLFQGGKFTYFTSGEENAAEAEQAKNCNHEINSVALGSDAFLA